MDWTLPQASDTQDPASAIDVIASIAECARESVSERALARVEHAARAAALASGASPEEAAAAAQRARLEHIEMVSSAVVEDALEQAERDARTQEFTRALVEELTSQPGTPEDVARGLVAELKHVTACAARSHAFAETAERAAARARAAAAHRAHLPQRRSGSRIRCMSVVRSQPRCRQRSRRTRRPATRPSSASDDGSGEPPRRLAQPGEIGGAS